MLMTWEDILGFSFGGAILVIMAFGIAFSAFTPSLDKWGRRYFISLFSLMFLCAVSCFFGLIFWYDPTMAAVERVVYIFEDTFLSLVIFMPTIFILHSCGENVQKSPMLWSATALLFAFFALELIAQFTNVFFYVTPDNGFVRGPLWAL